MDTEDIIGPISDLVWRKSLGELSGRERDGELGERGDDGPRESSPGVGIMVTYSRLK